MDNPEGNVLRYYKLKTDGKKEELNYKFGIKYK